MAIDTLNEAIRLIADGKVSEAQKLLEPFIEAHPLHIQAWLLEAETWPAATTKIRVLEMGLQHNPGNPQLQAALAAIKTQQANLPAVNAATPSNIRKPLASQHTLVTWLIVIALVVSLLGAGWGLAYRAACGNPFNAQAPIHILFIGNSFTYVNDLPGMFTQLACAGGHRVETAMAAEGGWTLANHLASPQTLDKLKQQKWDFVILQEQSQTPAIEPARTQGMYPAVRGLVNQIEALGAKPLLFMTWGYRNGWPEVGYQTYEAMQAQVTAGYLGIANELQIPVAPVGEAWRQVRTHAPSLDLWQVDGNHPNVQGTYLAACVFYAVIFRQSPEGLAEGEGLSSDTVQVLQTLAKDAVLTEPKRWNLR